MSGGQKFVVLIVAAVLLGTVGVVTGLCLSSGDAAAWFGLSAFALPFVFSVASLLWTAKPVGSGEVPGHAYRRHGETIEVFDLRVEHPCTLGRRELEEIASGIVSRRTGTLAVAPRVRDAAARILASGSATVVFLESHSVRFEGYERGDLAAIVRALVALAGPGIHLSKLDGPTACPFCKDVVEGGDVRACDACGAAHHGECYAEHGGCAIFACERSPSGRRSRARP